jgi:hypothetical protein
MLLLPTVNAIYYLQINPNRVFYDNETSIVLKSNIIQHHSFIWKVIPYKSKNTTIIIDGVSGYKIVGQTLVINTTDNVVGEYSLTDTALSMSGYNETVYANITQIVNITCGFNQNEDYLIRECFIKIHGPLFDVMYVFFSDKEKIPYNFRVTNSTDTIHTLLKIDKESLPQKYTCQLVSPTVDIEHTKKFDTFTEVDDDEFEAYQNYTTTIPFMPKHQEKFVHVYVIEGVGVFFCILFSFIAK